MLGRSKGNEANYGRDSSSVQQVPRSATASSAPPEVSSISSGLSIFGKIVDHGSLTILVTSRVNYTPPPSRSPKASHLCHSGL
jgi:hypothetical protein